MSNPTNSGGGKTGPTVGGGGAGGTCTTGPVGPQGTTVTVPVSNPSSIWITGPLFAGFNPGGVNEPAPPTPEKKCYKDGCVCKKCKELYPFSEPNQPDETLICWACRHNY